MTFEYEKVMNWPIPEGYQEYGVDDTILYALSVGAGGTPGSDDLHYIYEKGLVALPSMAVVLATGPNWITDPELGIDFTRLLHGEQSLTVHQPLPVSAKVKGKSYVEEIYDKGPEKGAVMVLVQEVADADTGELYATTKSAAFLRGNGGCGGGGTEQPKPHPVPDRTPDHVVDSVTRVEQAALYRLNGDRNPLHIDPSVANLAGFEKPILHGLCSYGIACRGVIAEVCRNDPLLLRTFNVRFARPVYPGDMLRTEIWLEEKGRVAFRTLVPERDQVVLDNGFAEYVV